jgi:large subunit ribosomal protein L6
MSRIGKKPIEVPESVVNLTLSGSTVAVEGPLGKLEQTFHSDMEITYDKGTRLLKVNRPSDNKKHRALHGLTRALIANMVHGVVTGYQKRLDIVGIGYNARIQGNNLVLQIGFSHPVTFEIPEGLVVEVPQNTVILVKGMDKQKVGQFAANVRAVRPPEPYKGKGIRYANEVIRRKAGKAFGSGEK